MTAYKISVILNGKELFVLYVVVRNGNLKDGSQLKAVEVNFLKKNCLLELEATSSPIQMLKYLKL